MSTWWMDCKNIKKKKISRWLFEIIHIIRFEMRMDRRINLKIFLGYDINYLSIWPFMGHPWFPTRKASKLRFTCFQLAGWWPCDCFQIAGWCHSPASWKQTNISFEAFLVGNQGWCIKGQMLRKFIWYPKSIFRFIRPSMCISKRIKWIKKNSHREKKIFCIFFQSPHQVGMKNIVKCPREFIAYFNALETTCGKHLPYTNFETTAIL